MLFGYRMADEGGAATTTRIRKQPRPEIQLYRPGMLRKGDSTKSLANDERPPRPEKIETSPSTTTTAANRRRSSNDADGVRSRGGSGSTTPDANVMNDKYTRFGANSRQPESSYNSTKSLYDSRKPGGYTEYNGRNHQRNNRLPFERSNNRNSSSSYNERASMRGDVAMTRRNVVGGGRRRNDSMNSTQSEMPQTTADPLHIDTSYDSKSQCGASSAFSMNSLGEAMSFEEMCQSLQSFSSMDWSKEVENEIAERLEREEEEKRLHESLMHEADERKRKDETRAAQSTRAAVARHRGGLQETNGAHHDSDRESSFGGSIAEEEDDNDELPSGERTPTSVRSGYHRSTKNATGRREKPERRYRGEHDDRDDETTEYDSLSSHMTSGRLAGRISIVKRAIPGDVHAERTSPRRDYRQSEESQRENANPKFSEESMLRRRDEPVRSSPPPPPASTSSSTSNDEVRINEIAEKIAKLAPLVAKKRDVEAAKKVVQLSADMSKYYYDQIFVDIFGTFSSSLEQQLFRNAFYKPIESLRSGSNSASPNAKLIRASFQRLLLNGIDFYETLINDYQVRFKIDLESTLIWPNGFPSDEQLNEHFVDLPAGSLKYSTTNQKIAIKSLSRHLVSLGDLHRYKTLVDGCEDYSTSQKFYLRASQLWPTSGHTYNQLGVVAYYSMLYRSARRARLIPVDVLSRQRQSRVIDEIFYLVRALSCNYPYLAAKDRLAQRIDAMRAKVSKYEPLLDSECGKLRDEMRMMSKVERAREVWIDLATGKAIDDAGETIVDDILAHFIEQSASKLHRRAVSYLIDAFGMLVNKIGMEHFSSVSERAFALLLASLSKPYSDFSSRQLVQLTAMFIYAVHSAAKKEMNSPQHHTAVSALFTLLAVLLKVFTEEKCEVGCDHELALTEKALIVLPSINLISTAVRKSDALQPNAIELLPSSIVTLSMTAIVRRLEQQFEVIASCSPQEAGLAFPENVFLASFCGIFDGYPTKADVLEGRNESEQTNRSRIFNVLKAMEMIRDRIPTDSSNDSGISTEKEEKPIGRDELLELEKRKNRFVLVVQPENLVVDTNVFIDHLDIVKRIVEKKHHKIVVPTMVLTELVGLSLPSVSGRDNLIDVSGGEQEEYVRANAKVAVAWLKERSRTKCPQMATLTTQGKKIAFLVATEDNTNHKKERKVNDDLILESCLNLIANAVASPSPSIPSSVAESHENVIHRNVVLLTEDRGLSIKAMCQRVPCRHIQQFSSLASI
ncbi:unnamed protein product [Caenorhabditis bovis]|uniref:PIN domain-containing protein n=1 Tax=Caenorhabditis bovis TaxID=2654633 RepID=A0A8S1EI42_9PELO|nr:unnamed protein product [Caenorhabditis bovis]